MPISLENIGGEVCEPVGGMSKVYYALHSDFLTINDPKKICDDVAINAAADYDDLSQIETAHVFKTGKCFKEIEFISETASLKSALIGEVQRHLFQNEAVFEIADSNAKVLGFARFVRNQKLVVLIEEFGSGRIRQLGSKRFGARTSALELVIEATVEGKNSAAVTVLDKNLGPAPIYKGAILLVPMV